MKKGNDQTNVNMDYLLKVGMLIFFITYLGFTLFPFYWMLTTALKSKAEAYTIPPQLWPYHPTLKNFRELVQGKIFPLRYLLNSFIIGGGVIGICLFTGVLAGYSLSRFQLRAKNHILVFILTFQMFPSVLVVIPVYMYYLRLGLLDTHLGLILVDSTLSIPFSVWLLKGFFDTIPVELEEAAAIDGCGRMRTLSKVILPLISPGIATVVVYAFLISWQEFVYGLTLANTERVRPVSPGISVSFLATMSMTWEKMMVAVIELIVPVALLYLFLQRYVIAGLTAGAVKK